MIVLLIWNVDICLHGSTLSSVRTGSISLADVFLNTTAPTIVSVR